MTFAAEIIFTIDPVQSSITFAATDVAFGAHVEQSAGSLTAPLSGHFLASFDPLSGTPTSLEFVGGHGQYRLGSTHVALPGIESEPTTALAANVAGMNSAGVNWAIRDLVWDFFTTSPLTLSGGQADAGLQTNILVLGGGFDSGLAGVFFDHDSFGGVHTLDAGTWTLSESAPGSGAWTLEFTGSKAFPFDMGSLDGDFTATSSLVATAQYGAPNVATVSETETHAEALGGASATGGVSAEFSQPTTGGTFSAQQVPDQTGLSQAALAAAGTNPLFLVSTDTLAANPQIWNVDFTGDLNGASVTLVFNYDPLLLPPGLDESTLGVWHYNTTLDAWQFGGTVDTLAHTVTYTTDSFSPFVLGVPEPSALVLAAAGAISLAAVAAGRRRNRRQSRDESARC
jgi:hypothetical protein